MGRLVLGVDGGGSSTVAYVASCDGEILGRAECGPSNLKSIGEDAGLRAIATAIKTAMHEAGTDRVGSACLGLAGIDHPDDRARVESWCHEQNFADQFVLVNDAELVLAAGTPERWGVAVIAGTGSIAVGRSAHGPWARAGGWGHIFGDEGSGFGTAIAALRLVSQRFDGRIDEPWQNDPLSIAICREVGVPDPSGLVNRIYAPEYDRARIARLAAVVVATSAHDERCRTHLLEPAGRALAEIVLAIARRLDLPRSPLPLAIAGGFILSSQVVEQTLVHSLQRAGYEVLPGRVDDPVVGAIQLAIA